MPIRTPGGSILAKDVRAGTQLLSRDEHDPDGLVVVQSVEEVFERWSGVWVLGVNGRGIETTTEHPFFVLGEGWMWRTELWSQSLPN